MTKSKKCPVCKVVFHRTPNITYKRWDSQVYCKKLCAMKAIDKDPTKPIIERFWDKVLRSEKTKCWPWIGAVDKRGYGRFYSEKKMVLAHRFSWELEKSIIPEGLVCRHICDNPACVNPNHLTIGTLKDNSKDCTDRGRNGNKGSTRGEDHYSAKLDERTVRLVRLAYSGGAKACELAAVCGCTINTINNCVSGKTWSHLK